MLVLTTKVRKALQRIAEKGVTDLLREGNIDLIRSSKNPIINDTVLQGVEHLITQLPDTPITKISQLISFIETAQRRNTESSVSYSPIIATYKEFKCCKMMKFTKGNIITGRDNEIEQILLTLRKSQKRGVILVGEPGVGKTAIVNAVNTRLIQRTVPRQLIGCQILNMDIPYILTKFKEDPMGTIIKALERASEYDKVILFIDEVHQLLSHRMNDIMKPYLTEKIRFIGSTTENEYHAIITDDTALERRFRVINVDEPSVERTVEMVRNTKTVYEEYHKCTVPDDICRYLTVNGSRFLGHRKNPDKSLDVLDLACSILYEQQIGASHTPFRKTGDLIRDIEKPLREVQTWKDVSGNRVLTKEHVDLAISSQTGIDYHEVKNSLNYNEVSKAIKDIIFGQDKAIDSLANMINLFKHVRYDRDKPIATLLIVGPAGVGKRSAAKELARKLYGSDSHFIEMPLGGMKSEFMITELKGAPPGYVGYSKSGSFIKSIRNNPQSIVYFSGSNNAHESIIQYLLECCRHGTIKDSADREAALNNAVIIFSVTLSKEDYERFKKDKAKSMGFGKDADSANEKPLEDRLKKVIREELVEKCEEIILFSELNSKTLDKIYKANVKEQLSIYEGVDIDQRSLKKQVMEDSKNGHDIISKLSSRVPRMVFKKLKQ